MIWDVNNRNRPSEYETEDLVEAMLQIRNIHGRDSVWIALQATGLVLQGTGHDQSLGWTLFPQAGLPATAFNTLRGLTAEVRIDTVVLQCISRCSRLLWIDQIAHDRYRCVPTPWAQDTRSGDSMLAIRPYKWPDTCSTFCLFVLPEIGDGSSRDLHRLLEEAVSMRNYYENDGYRRSRKETQTLRQWRKALVSEKMIAA